MSSICTLLPQLTGEYQSHSGAVVQGTTPEVQYAYTEMSGGQNNSRLTSMNYPSGYALNFNYNTGMDSNINRLSSISDSANTLESYKYLGLDTVVERDHPQTNINLSFIYQTGDALANHDGGDQYTGLDRFGRVIDQNWVNGTTGTSTDRYQYSYNQDSEVVSRNNTLDAAMNETYSYDNLGQLTSFARGTHTQTWTPDALGNFTGVTTNGTTQTRTANQQNEYTSISGSGTITYDANGNLTADRSGNTFVYDAWNRLVAVKNGSTTLAGYSYDGLNHRITETHGSTTTDLYYSSNWQVLEERNNGQLQARYVWSPAGVDTLVLRDDSSQNNGVIDRRLYVQQDTLGNVTALADTSGNVVERYDYDPFGAATVLNPDFSVRGTSSYNWNYLFQGKRYDGTVGLYDSRERIYSPTLMRWLQTDPLGQFTGPNGYEAYGNQPTDMVDPSGLAPSPDEGSVQWASKEGLARLEEVAARNQKLIDQLRKIDKDDPRLLFLETQQRILEKMKTNEHFAKDKKAGEWLGRVLTVFMDSLQNAMNDKIVGKIKGRVFPKFPPKEMLDFMAGRKAGPWWCEYENKAIDAYNKRGVAMRLATKKEFYAMAMADTHIMGDLKHAILFEGVGTDEDWAEIGKIVEEAANEVSDRWKLTREGAIWSRLVPDIAKIRDEMRQGVIKLLKATYGIDPSKNPYQGARGQIATGLLNRR